MKKALVTIASAAIIYITAFALEELRLIVQAYAQKTYYTVPLYIIRIFRILLYALAARAAYAYLRKPIYCGQLQVNLYALLAVCVFVICSVLDYLFGVQLVLKSEIFCIIEVFTALCIVEKGSDGESRHH
jgi:hypothetical protein